ncbi:MAG: EamA family transporter [Desulfofustis sp.]|nr:EamA family transporter [Desulfofustis sp.]
MLFSTTLVSTSFIVAELITDTLDPIVLTLVRFILAVIFLLPIISIRHGLAITVGSLCRYAAISACLVLFFWAMFLSLRYTSPLNISVLFTLVPAISAVYAAIINRERISTSLLLALIVGLIGAVWVIFEGDLQRLRELAWNRGDLIFFGGCLAMALYTPLVRLLHRHEPMEVMTFWVLVTGCFWLLPGAVRIFARTSMTTIPSTTWLWIVYLALFSTVISFYCTQYATRIIGPTRTIAYSYLYPLLVVGLNYFLGRGWPAMQVIPGIVLTLAAMLLLLPSSGGDTGGVAED